MDSIKYQQMKNQQVTDSVSRGCTGIQERGDDDYNKQGI